MDFLSNQRSSLLCISLSILISLQFLAPVHIYDVAITGSNPSTEAVAKNSTNLTYASSSSSLDTTLLQHYNGTASIISPVEDSSRFLHTYHVGFSKCGTTSVLFWFRNHPELIATLNENPITHGTYESARNQVARIYTRHGTKGRPLQVAAKYPSAIYESSDMDMIRNHFPHTKIVVGIRHPMLWFRSFYNFRMVDKPKGPLPHPIKLVGPCEVDNHVCTDHARFHFYLAQAFGDGPSSIPEERQLILGNTSNVKLFLNTSASPSYNKIFLYDVGQLADSNTTRNKQFRRDMADFLELNASFPEAPRIKPETLGQPGKLKKRIRNRLNATIQDFCLPEYRPVRQVLMRHAHNVADWIQTYFVSPENNNVVLSSPNFFHTLIDSYRNDPFDCGDMATQEWEN